MPSVVSARTTRIAILLSDPLQGLARVVDRLTIQALEPRRIFLRARGRRSVLLLEFDGELLNVDVLVTRFRQMPSVISAKMYQRQSPLLAANRDRRRRIKS